MEETDGPLPFPVPTLPRVTGVLTAVAEELPDVPFFYHLPELASAVKSKVCEHGGRVVHAGVNTDGCCCVLLQVPVLVEFQAALVNLGYRVSQVGVCFCFVL